MFWLSRRIVGYISKYIHIYTFLWYTVRNAKSIYSFYIFNVDAIEPCIKQLFVPITFLGSMGLSYQLALLMDIISVIGLHAHCFSIYAAVLVL